MKKEIYAVVINWNRADLTTACLESLSKFKSNKYFLRIVVVDNNSKDDSAQRIKKIPISLFFIQNKINMGWAEGHNVGIRFSLKKGAKAVFVFANDAVVTPETIEILADRLFNEKNAGIIGPKTYYFEKRNVIADAGGVVQKHRYFGTNRGQGKIDKGQFNNLSRPDYVTGSAMLIRKDVFREVGFFDKRLFIYYEDVDFCYRAKEAGFDVIFEPKAIIYHHFAATTKIGSPLHSYYTTRNHYLFVEKHAPFIVKLREYLRTPKTSYEFMMRHDNSSKYSLLGIRDYFLRRFGKRVYW